MPGYGQISPAAARGFWQASDTPSQVYFRYNEGSLLAQNFNAMWCTALNMLYRGEQVDYWAMQHADIGPQDGWLDMAIDELEARNLDVLGVVIPIKDNRGSTSIALERPDPDPWHPLCRLTMEEVYRLPETFTSEDVGHKLLLNTGLWVCRFDKSWVMKGLHFTINDRIVFDKSREMFIAETEPEDWNFSRQLHKLGLRIGATRKIAAKHRGDTEFSNEYPWGTCKFDDQWIGQSVVPEDGFQFPADVEGWLSYKEGRALADLCRDKAVLEVGSYLGRSTICIAQTASSVVSVDTHDGRGTAVPQDTLPQFAANLSRYGVRQKVDVNSCSFEDFINWQDPDQTFELIFIDGAHDYKSVVSDIVNATSLMAPGGLLVFHDYRSPLDPDVSTAVDELISAGAELISTHDSLAVVRPPAAVPLEV